MGYSAIHYPHGGERLEESVTADWPARHGNGNRLTLMRHSP